MLGQSSCQRRTRRRNSRRPSILSPPVLRGRLGPSSAHSWRCSIHGRSIEWLHPLAVHSRCRPKWLHPLMMHSRPRPEWLHPLAMHSPVERLREHAIHLRQDSGHHVLLSHIRAVAQLVLQ
eukprot:5966175-Pyramimonas_sp.AAC.1